MNSLDTKNKKQQTVVIWLSLLVAFLAMNYYWFKSPVTIAFDPNDEKCLDDVHLSVLVKQSDVDVQRGNMLFWEPKGALAYVKQAYIMKVAAGVPGDHLQIKDQKVLINGKIVASGMPLVDPTKIAYTAFDRDEIIPPGHVFMMGTHPRSYDSRYWGYLSVKDVVGRGYKII